MDPLANIPHGYSKRTFTEPILSDQLADKLTTEDYVWVEEPKRSTTPIILPLEDEEEPITHDSIPTFSFAPLDLIRKDLKEIGYSDQEIESTITGLSELPEYANSNRNKKSDR